MERNTEKLYKRIAALVIAIENCRKTANIEWEEKHIKKIEQLVKENMPHGSGFDNGTFFNHEKSKENKLVFDTSYHHMNENGYYDGWTDHEVIVTPDLAFNFALRITGKNRNEIKEYMADCFIQALEIEVN